MPNTRTEFDVVLDKVFSRLTRGKPTGTMYDCQEDRTYGYYRSTTDTDTYIRQVGNGKIEVRAEIIRSTSSCETIDISQLLHVIRMSHKGAEFFSASIMPSTKANRFGAQEKYDGSVARQEDNWDVKGEVKRATHVLRAILR